MTKAQFHSMLQLLGPENFFDIISNSPKLSHKEIERKLRIKKLELAVKKLNLQRSF